MINKIFKLEIFTILFILFSTVISLIGGFVFIFYKVYEYRYLNLSSQYFKIYLFIFILINLIIIIYKSRFNINNYEKKKFTDLKIFNLILVILLFFMMPFQLYYLLSLVQKGIYYGSLDFARYEFYKEAFLPRLFWYSSFLFGYLLILKKFNYLNKYLINFIIMIELIILILYGSKILFIFPIISYIISLNYLGIDYYDKRDKINIASFLILILIILPIYNNIRSSLSYKQSEVFLIDLSASIMPEQRDGAFLIFYLDETYKDNNYIKVIGQSVLCSLLGSKRISSLLLDINYDYYLEKYINIIQLSLGYHNFNPRIGLIGSSYIFGGRLFGYIGPLIYIFILIVNILLFYKNYPKFGLLELYSFILIYLYFLYTFNSDFIINLPWVIYNIQFYFILKIIKIVTHKIK